MTNISNLRNLASLNKDEILSFIESFDTVLTDCDGVLWLAKDPIPGSSEVIKKLKDIGKKVFLVSNNSTMPIDRYLLRCNMMGIQAQREEIVTPSVMVASYLQKQMFQKKAYVLATKTFKAELSKSGIECIDTDIEEQATSIAEYMAVITNLDPQVGAVIIDFDPNINYIKIMKAIYYLKNPECQFIVGATDEVAIIAPNTTIVGPSGFTAIIEKKSGRKPIILGKPSTLIKDFLNEKHCIIPHRTLMIGDMIDQDILLGTSCGFQTLLVLSGYGTLEDMAKQERNLPNYYIKKLGDLLPHLKSSTISSSM